MEFRGCLVFSLNSCIIFDCWKILWQNFTVQCEAEKKKKIIPIKKKKKTTKPEQNKNSPAFEFPVWSFPWMACRYCTKKWIITPPHFLHNIPDSVLLCYIHHRHVFSFSRGFIPLIIFVTFSLPSLVIQRFQKECDQNWTYYSRINTMNEVPGYKDNLESSPDMYS